MAYTQSGPVQNPGALGLYNQQLQLQLANYNQISSAYNQAQANATTALGGIYGDYANLGRNVNDLMESAYNVGSKDIQSNANRTLSQVKSSAINSGLGNSTIQMALQNQATALTNREYGRLTNDVMQQAADRQTQIGLAGLQARQQGLGLQAGLSQNYMGNISHYDFSPNVPLYGQSSYSYTPDPVRGGGGGGYGGGSLPGGRPSNWSGGLSPEMESIWDNRYGSPNRMGYAGLYTYPTYGNYGGGVNYGESTDMGGYGDDYLIF